MKKLISILIVIFLIIYVLVEFIGDNIIKSSLENNLSNTLKRETKIDDLSIGYLSGKAEIKNLKISNKDLPGILLEIKNASAKLSTTSIFSNRIEIDEIILATTKKSEDDVLVDLCKKLKVLTFRGSEQNVLSRFYFEYPKGVM